ncbi:MAG: NOP5/NOP56 family protein [Nitrososphaerales archaeon]
MCKWLDVESAILVCEAGLALLDDKLNPIFAKPYREDPLKTYRMLLLGETSSILEEFLKEAVGIGVRKFKVEEDGLRVTIESLGYPCAALEDDVAAKIKEKRLELMVSAGLVESVARAEELVRQAAIYLAEAKIREASAKPDLQIIQSIQALDEVDKAANIFTARLKEWFGLHFPELSDILTEPENYIDYILTVGYRHLTRELAGSLKLAERKIEIILEASEKSKGADIREEDLSRIKMLAKEVKDLYALRKSLQRHIEVTMTRIAPNLTALAGATIAARLIAKAGGLERLARLPASTIQVLGAEKALFRALRTGAPPPKHGLLFQHKLVHSAPTWQRGKVARSLAAKIALAARVDVYRGERDKSLDTHLEKRIEEIKSKYPKAPKVSKPKGAKYGAKKHRARK